MALLRWLDTSPAADPPGAARVPPGFVHGILHSGDLPLNVLVHGCGEPPCLLPQLQDAVIDVIFRAPRTISNMTTFATATVNIIIDMTVPYDLGEYAKTCNFFTNTWCPILEGEIVKYRLKMYIERFFPVNTFATAEFMIVDNDRNGELIWCIRLPIRITPPAPERAISDANGVRSISDANEVRAISDANEEQDISPVQVVNDIL
ncbi:uncharacterized protein [Maniola hyperantus]|uniref:uncharacterized protein n=1 Tax=Aphantopus hyperantus TaxID=2795564 RepID=UPI003747C058